tara:strand:+ start:244 stop:474 length:231 start_codon:yes stop_codon:yes gene_type:complete
MSNKKIFIELDFENHNSSDNDLYNTLIELMYSDVQLCWSVLYIKMITDEGKSTEIIIEEKIPRSKLITGEKKTNGK